MSYVPNALRKPRRGESQYQKVGMCCGRKCVERKRHEDQMLFRTPGDTFRCRTCYRREYGRESL